MEEVTVECTVFSGKGEGKKYVSLYFNTLRDALGIKPYLGTLNLDCNKDLRKLFTGAHVITIEPPSPKYKPVLAIPIEIDGIEGYALRPLASKYKWSVLEIVSTINIREKLGLRDGDKVIVILKP